MAAEKIGAGDITRIPSDQKHRHGASPTTGPTRIAIRETLEGKNVDWLEKPSDEQYATAR